jgi:hypothetical protein
MALGAQEAGQHVDRQTRRQAVLERHKHHLVAAVRHAVPGAVLADEHAGRQRARQRLAFRKGHAQRRHVRAQRVVGRHGLGHQVGPCRPDAVVHVAAVIAVGPAVEDAIAHRSQVVGHQVAADLVALVDHRPERAGPGRPAHAVGVAQAGGEHAVLAGFGVHFPNGGAAGFGLHAALADVAVGAHGHVELAAVGIGDDVFGPVVVDGAGRKVHDLDGRRRDAGLARLVGKAHDGIGVGHVKIIAHQHHAER